MISYAVVGAGWISQEAFLPAVATTGNSRLQAIVSGSAEAARRLADFHGAPEVVSYADYDALLAENDQDLIQWVLGQSAPPDRFAALIAQIAAHARGRLLPGL